MTTIKPVEPSKALGVKYNAQLQRILLEVKKDVNRTLIPLLKSISFEYIGDSWVDTLSSALSQLNERWVNNQLELLYNKIASEFVYEGNRINRDKFNKQMKSLGVNSLTDSPELTDYLKACIKSNVSLIRSIPEKYLNNVENLIYESTRAGLSVSYIEKQLLQTYDISKKHAKLIARDQTGKLSGQLNKIRQKSLGFKYFKWITSQDGRVRHRHIVISKTDTDYGIGTYRWDHLPLSDKGVPIAPGDDYQCRCVAIPVTQKTVDKYRENKDK